MIYKKGKSDTHGTWSLTESPESLVNIAENKQETYKSEQIGMLLPC